MPSAITFRKRKVYHVRRKFIPQKRLIKNKSLYPRRTIYIHKGRFRLYKNRTLRTRMFRRFNLYMIPRSTVHSKKMRGTVAPKRTTVKKSYSWEKTSSSRMSVSRKTTRDWHSAKIKWNEVWSSESYKGFYKPRQQKIKDSQRQKHQWQQNMSKWNEQLTKEKQARFRHAFDMNMTKREFRGGDTSSHRKYKNYGPMKALGPKLIFEMIPTMAFLEYRKTVRNKPQYESMKNKTYKLIDELLYNLSKHADKIIDRYVPKDTGALREAMRHSIKKTKRKGWYVKVELDTANIWYANPVNNMPERMLRHTMAKSRKGRILNDPHAVHGWWQFIDMQLNTEAKKLLKIFYKQLQGVWIEQTFGVPVPSLRVPRRYGQFLPYTPHNRYTENIRERELLEQRAKWRLNVEERRRHEQVRRMDIKTIEGFFKIRGLNKR